MNTWDHLLKDDFLTVNGDPGRFGSKNSIFSLDSLSEVTE